MNEQAAETFNNNKELNSFLDDIRDAGMAVTNRWKDIWFTAIQYAWGEQLQGWNLKEDWEYTVINRIYPLMFQTISKLAGNNPKILTHAWDDEKPGATDYAERWAGHLQYLWESPYEMGMRLKLIMGLLDCAIFGYMVGYTHWEHKPLGGWNPTQKRWIGKVEETFIHPAMFWCSDGSEFVSNAEACGMTRRVKLEYALNRWPQFKKEIEAQAYTSDDPKFTAGDLITYTNQKGSTTVSRKTMFSKLVSLILNTGGSEGVRIADTGVGEGKKQQKYIDIEQIYWHDYEEKHVKIEDNVPKDILIKQGKIIEEELTGIFLDAQTKKPLENWPKQVTDAWDEPKYPSGRFALRIGKTILNEDEEDQVYKESRWPFTVMPYHILPHMWQGGNAVEMARTNNDFLNITVSSVINQVRRTADPTKGIEAGSLAKDRDGKTRTTKDDITGLGRIIVFAKGKLAMMRNIEVQPLDPAVPGLVELLKKDIDDQSFMQPIARGEAQKKQQTKGEITRLDRSSLEYVSLQGVFLDKWIDDTETLVAELCQGNYEPDRLIKITNEDTQQAGFKVVQEMLDVRFDVNIEPGSTLPFDEAKKQQEYATAYKMFENPIPNPMIEDMLRVLNISKRKEILTKYQGLQLFRKFIMMGTMLQQIPPEQLQGAIQSIPIPGVQQALGQLAQLLMQAGQLAPAMKMGAK